MGFDKAIFRPVAKGYDVVMPDAPQRGVRNFFRNLAYPVTFINLILQGKFEDSLTATGRFLMNSTVGVLGLLMSLPSLKCPSTMKTLARRWQFGAGKTAATW